MAASAARLSTPSRRWLYGRHRVTVGGAPTLVGGVGTGIGRGDMPEREWMALVSTTGKSEDQVADDLIAALDAYWRAHPDEKPPNWDEEGLDEPE